MISRYRWDSWLMKVGWNIEEGIPVCGVVRNIQFYMWMKMFEMKFDVLEKFIIVTDLYL